MNDEQRTGNRAADLWHTAQEVFLRVAATGLVPAWLFQRARPDRETLPARAGPLELEIVSHCWNYDFLLAYQLSSLVNHPPANLTVRMTVFYTPDDRRTAELLEFFSGQSVPGVTWNWQPLDKTMLLRRSIGRNLAARRTTADWVWFTDCDVIFHRGCLDTLAEQLQGRRDPLVYPREERSTALLSRVDPMLLAAARKPGIVDIETSRFVRRKLTQATGPLQITHGDVARAFGYCDALAVYQKPTNRWRKCYEDRAFRWLLRTPGVGIDVPGVYRIRHASKGRYESNRALGFIRGSSRRIRSWASDRVHSGRR
ncbi:MAG TPA: glycosyltransferase family A protein [Thermoanaerobaculia bacterium]|nr:glycosyltransferase family A protein [Thermoanaerobaculia bacterium]